MAYKNNNKDNKHRTPKISAKIDRLYDNPDNVIKASASVFIADAVAIHELRVMDSSKGLFVGMPTRSYEDRNGSTKYVDIAHPITAEMREALNDSVLKAYEQAIAENQTEDFEETDDEDLPFEQSM